MSKQKSTRTKSDTARLDLQDCPYCHTSHLLAAGPRVDGYVNRWSVSCAHCGAVGPLGTDELDAAKQWNARVPPNPLVDCTVETLSRVALMQEWLLNHPLREVEGGYAPHFKDEMRCGDTFVCNLIKDAVAYEAARHKKRRNSLSN